MPDDQEWSAKTHFVDVTRHAAAVDAEAHAPGENTPVEPFSEPVEAAFFAAPAPVREDGFASVVTVIGQAPAIYRGELAQEEAREWSPIWVDRVSARLRLLGTRVRDDFRKAPPAIRIVFLALPAIGWMVLTLGNPTSEDPGHAASAVASSSARAATIPAPHDELTGALPAPVMPRDPPARSKTGPAKRTDEARAADAAARGATAEAIALYEEIAADHPERIEFATAARILKAQATGAR
jgi:hypothetical protein